MLVSGRVVQWCNDSILFHSTLLDVYCQLRLWRLVCCCWSRCVSVRFWTMKLITWRWVPDCHRCKHPGGYVLQVGFFSGLLCGDSNVICLMEKNAACLIIGTSEGRRHRKSEWTAKKKKWYIYIKWTHVPVRAMSFLSCFFCSETWGDSGTSGFTFPSNCAMRTPAPRTMIYHWKRYMFDAFSKIWGCYSIINLILAVCTVFRPTCLNKNPLLEQIFIPWGYPRESKKTYGKL